MGEIEFKSGMIIYILVNQEQVRSIIDTWVDCDYRCDLLVHRSSHNPGKFVVETTEPVWASRIVKWHGCEKVTYKEPKKDKKKEQKQ